MEEEGGEEDVGARGIVREVMSRMGASCRRESHSRKEKPDWRAGGANRHGMR